MDITHQTLKGSDYPLPWKSNPQIHFDSKKFNRHSTLSHSSILSNSSIERMSKALQTLGVSEEDLIEKDVATNINNSRPQSYSNQSFLRPARMLSYDDLRDEKIVKTKHTSYYRPKSLLPATRKSSANSPKTRYSFHFRNVHQLSQESQNPMTRSDDQILILGSPNESHSTVNNTPTNKDQFFQIATNFLRQNSSKIHSKSSGADDSSKPAAESSSGFASSYKNLFDWKGKRQSKQISTTNLEQYTRQSSGNFSEDPTISPSDSIKEGMAINTFKSQTNSRNHVDQVLLSPSTPTKQKKSRFSFFKTVSLNRLSTMLKIQKSSNLTDQAHVDQLDSGLASGVENPENLLPSIPDVHQISAADPYYETPKEQFEPGIVFETDIDTLKNVMSLVCMPRQSTNFLLDSEEYPENEKMEYCAPIGSALAILQILLDRETSDRPM